MIQPQWITPEGNLGTWDEGTFYDLPVKAVAGDEPVFYRLISGNLPAGVQLNSNGVIEGIPKNIVTVQGVPQEVAEDTTSKFTIRAFTRNIDGSVKRLNDRTFTVTVSGQDAPRWITPPGNIGSFYDGTQASVQAEFEDRDPGESLTVSLVSGELPPGMVLDSKTGKISGVIFPLVGPPGTANPGYDMTQFDQYPYSFPTRGASKNYQFSLEVTDGKQSDVRNFEIFVYAKDTMTADNTNETSDNTFITADVTPARIPLILTPEGDLGIVRADNFYAFQFNAIDFDGDEIEYLLITGDQGSQGFYAIPPGLTFNTDNGWLYGYIPYQGLTELTYQWALRARKKFQLAVLWSPSLVYLSGSVVSFQGNNYVALQTMPPGITPTNAFYWEQEQIPTSRFYYFDITIIGNIDSEVTWLSPVNLGTIDNGAISTLSVSAINVGGKPLQYQIVSGSNSKLPQGLSLNSSGNIVGRVSFNTFALDGGTTTFDVTRDRSFISSPTTFDMEFEFTVNAFAPLAGQLGYEVFRIDIVNGGSGYTGQPTITISSPPETVNATQATAGIATIVNGVITSITVNNPGQGYLSPPSVVISGGGGTGAQAVAAIRESTIINSVSVFRRFKITVNRRFNEPYESLYIQCMPPENDRELISSLVQNQDLIPQNLVYRSDDPNFGVAQKVIYQHAFGLTVATIQDYVNAMDINHYWKHLVLGPIRTARATDAQGTVIYEVIYSEIIDNLVNNQGVSVGKSVLLPYGIRTISEETITLVYPNSLDNMRNQMLQQVGRVSPALPAWMTSKQDNGTVLGFRPAWAIAYVKPGESAKIAYNIRTRFGDRLNRVDFKADRYILDRSQTKSWDPITQQWIPQPPAATVFDQPPIPPGGPPETIFDGNSTEFITPADRWLPTDEFNKYLMFPKRDILQ
jgi:hypothetical protein